MTAPASLPGTHDAVWHRLHPLSPLVRAGRGLVGLVVLLLVTRAQSGSSGRDVGDLAVVGLALVAGFVSWLVTRWRVEAGVLRIDGGLVRRTSKRFPLVQVQAIDIVQPVLARMFGLAELRVRMAGAQSGAGRLAYLPEVQAEELRARLLALAHGLAEETPAPQEQPLLTVATPRLIASLVLTGPGLVAVLAACALVVLAVVAPSVAGAVLGGGAAFFLGLATASWRRFNGSYHLSVAEAGDGLRLRSGLLQTAAETIPRGRVQAVRLVEPLLWQPFGWCRLEVDVAGKQRRKGENESQGRSLRALLPVGDRDQAGWLLSRVFVGVPEGRRPPPARARWKSPLRFRRLSWGSNDTYVVTTSGRLQRVTDWVPLSKVQSVRCVEGPVQRRLHLASIHLDTAGRNVHAELRDRDGEEATQLLADLPRRCAGARQREGLAR